MMFAMRVAWARQLFCLTQALCRRRISAARLLSR